MNFLIEDLRELTKGSLEFQIHETWELVKSYLNTESFVIIGTFPEKAVVATESGDLLELSISEGSISESKTLPVGPIDRAAQGDKASLTTWVKDSLKEAVRLTDRGQSRGK